MKKYLRIILLVLVVGFLTTGCMEENISMVVNNDKSMDFSMYMSLDLKAMQDLANSFGGTNEEMTDEEYLNCIDENDGDDTNCIAPGSSSSSFDIDDIKDSINKDAIKEWEEEGYTVTQNVTSDKLELNLSKKYNNIDDISSNEDVIYNFNDEESKFFKMEKGFLANKYTFHMINDSQNIENNGSSFNFDMENFDLSTLSNMVNMNFQITLPNESISNNATSISNDKKTLNWDLTSNENKEISVTFALPNENKNLIIYGGIGLGVLLILIILIVVIFKNRKKKANNTPNKVANVSQEQNSQNVIPNQQINNQNLSDQVVNQSMNNGPVSMPINGAISLENQVSTETATPIIEQQVKLNPSLGQSSVTPEVPVESQPVMSSPIIDQSSVTPEVPVESQLVMPSPIIDQSSVTPEVPVESQPVMPSPIIDQSSVTPEVPVESQPVMPSPIIYQSSVTPEVSNENQPIDMESSSSTSANEINQINTDLKNMALNILNHNNDNN